MTHILTVGHAVAVSAVSTNGVTWFLLVLAAAAGARLGWLAPIAIFVLYLLLHAGPVHGAVHISALISLWAAIAAVTFFIGWQLGGRGILRHVGEREYRTRLSAAKGISSIWKSWSGDAK